jgi:hypothetical protein
MLYRNFKEAVSIISLVSLCFVSFVPTGVDALDTFASDQADVTFCEVNSDSLYSSGEVIHTTSDDIYALKAGRSDELLWEEGSSFIRKDGIEATKYVYPYTYTMMDMNDRGTYAYVARGESYDQKILYVNYQGVQHEVYLYDDQRIDSLYVTAFDQVMYTLESSYGADGSGVYQYNPELRAVYTLVPLNGEQQAVLQQSADKSRVLIQILEEQYDDEYNVTNHLLGTYMYQDGFGVEYLADNQHMYYLPVMNDFSSFYAKKQVVPGTNLYEWHFIEKFHDGSEERLVYVEVATMEDFVTRVFDSWYYGGDVLQHMIGHTYGLLTWGGYYGPPWLVKDGRFTDYTKSALFTDEDYYRYITSLSKKGKHAFILDQFWGYDDNPAYDGLYTFDLVTNEYKQLRSLDFVAQGADTVYIDNVVEDPDGRIYWTEYYSKDDMQETAICTAFPKNGKLTTVSPVGTMNVQYASGVIDNSQADMDFAIKHIGKIFIDVDDKGRAWYVHDDGYRFELKADTVEEALEAYDLMDDAYQNIPMAAEDFSADEDSDDDSYNDKLEVENGYDPFSRKKLVIDEDLAQEAKGRIYWDDDTYTYWFVGADAKRHQVDYWNAEDIFKRYAVGITGENIAKIPIKKLY